MDNKQKITDMKSFDLENPRVAKTKGTTEQWVTTLVIYYCNLALGVSATFLAPVLISFAKAYSTDVQTMSLVITICRYLNLASSLAFGYIYGFINRHALVTVQVFTMAAVLYLLPHGGSLPQFGILFALMNIAAGGFVTATVVWVMDIWGHRAGPFIQAQHFVYAMGTIIPPTIFASVLKKEQLANDLPSSADSANVSWSMENNSTLTELDHMTGVYIPSLICGLIISAGAFLMLITLFMYRTPKHYVQTSTEEPTVEPANGTDETGIESPVVIRVIQWKRISVVILSSLLIGALQSMEMIVSNFLPTYGHFSHFRSTEAEGAKILSAFSLAFTAARLVGILAILKLKAKTILVINIVIVTGANVLLIGSSSTGNRFYLWVGAVLLGIGYSTCVPTCFAFLREHINITNFVGSVLIVGGRVIAAFYPLVVGAYIEGFANILAWLNLGTIIAAVSLFAGILVLVGAKNKEKL